jgi:tRNA modification GTPase
MQRETLREVCGANPTVKVSALTGEGIDDLRRAIKDLVLGGNLDTSTSPVAPNLRHRQALGKAARFFRAAASEAAEGSPVEIIALEMNAGLEALGEIVGKTTDEGILDRIFSEFCLGK